jgi:hypothetical protein
MPTLTISSPSTRLSGTDPTILAHVIRGLRQRGHGLRHVVALSSELIGLTYQLSRLVIQISAFVALPTSTSKSKPRKVNSPAAQGT